MKHIQRFALVIVCGALASCEDNSTQTKSGDVEILETWSNGKVKKDKLQLRGDTSRITTYHDNFKVHMVGEVVLSEGQEVKHGEWKSFYPNGVNWSLNTYSMGVSHGAYKTWHPNGELNIVGNYSLGVSTGVWQFMDSTGTVIKQVNATPGE